MTDELFEVSRRRLLAGLGTIGVASAGAGLGTTAYFSDREEFDANTLVAGELDMKVSYEEHYSDWSPDELDGINKGDVAMTQPGDLDNWTGITGDDVGPLWVRDENVSTFMNNTEIVNSTAGKPLRLLETPCDPVGATANDDPAAHIDIGDVKPGDFGEVTFDFHLCTNPGYVWMYGNLVDASENGYTEPEMDDPDETGDQDNDGEDDEVELLDEIQTRVWHDDGDNVLESGERTSTPVLSLGELLVCLEGGNGLRLCSADSSSLVTPPGGNGCPDEEDYDSVHTTGDTVTVNTPLTGGDVSHTISQNPKCTDFGLLQAVKTDEAPEGPLPAEGTKTYSTPYGDITVTTELPGPGGPTRDSETLRITDWSISDTNAQGESWCIAKVIVKGGQVSDTTGANVYSYDNDNGNDDFTDDDDVGAKGDADTQLQTPTGQAISHVEFCVQPDTNGDSVSVQETDSCCFAGTTTHHVGFAWWLPVDHANEIQTDSVEFDLGFYTEQCRHNDGSGQPPETTTT